MTQFGIRFLCGACFLALSSAASAAPAWEMQGLVEAALAQHPLVAAAEAGLRRAEALVEGGDGFYSVQASAAAGWDFEDGRVAGVEGEGSRVDDALRVQAGVEKAVAPGVYLGVGAAERRLLDPGQGEALHRTTAGIQARIPLLRDRGFAEWRHAQAGRLAARDEAASRVLRVRQEVQRDVEERCIQCLQAMADLATAAAAATGRSRALLKDAEDLVRLDVQPEHQLYPARLDVAMRREELAAAEAAVTNSRRRLLEVAGPGALRLLPDQAVDMAAMAAMAADAPMPARPQTGGGARRGAYLEAGARVAAAEAEQRAFADQERSDLSLQAAYTWQGEAADSGFASEPLVTDRSDGGEVLLVWKRALGATTERAAVRAGTARVAELWSELESIGRSVEAEFDVAAEDLRAARERMALVGEAVTHARAALAAEEERFRLGEGTSRQVLDAQNDLTAAARRQDAVAAALLRAQSACRYAAGLTGWRDGAADKGRP